MDNENKRNTSNRKFLYRDQNGFLYTKKRIIINKSIDSIADNFNSKASIAFYDYLIRYVKEFYPKCFQEAVSVFFKEVVLENNIEYINSILNLQKINSTEIMDIKDIKDLLFKAPPLLFNGENNKNNNSDGNDLGDMIINQTEEIDKVRTNKDKDISECDNNSDNNNSDRSNSNEIKDSHAEDYENDFLNEEVFQGETIDNEVDSVDSDEIDSNIDNNNTISNNTDSIGNNILDNKVDESQDNQGNIEMDTNIETDVNRSKEQQDQDDYDDYEKKEYEEKEHEKKENDIDIKELENYKRIIKRPLA